MSQYKKHNRIALPMEVLQKVEEALNVPAFFGMPVGATLNDVMVVALSDAKHVWGWRSRVRDALRMVYQRFHQPFSAPADFAPYRGRILFTWLYARLDMKALVVPLLNNYDRDDYVVLGPAPEMQEQLPGNPAFLSWEQFPAISMSAWRREFARCLPVWRERLNEVFRTYGVPSEVANFLLSHLQTQTQFVMACDRFLDQVAPTVLVTEYDRNSYASCLLLAARKRGIPSVTMVHAAAMPYPSYGMTPLLATRVCCWGEVHREKFQRYGTSDEKLVITGCQATTAALEADRESALRKAGVITGQPVVLLGTSPVRLEDRINYAGVFCDALTQLSEVVGIVRLHPAEHFAEYQELIDKYPHVKFLTNAEMSRDESLACADIIVSHESSFGIDALLRRKFVIVLNLKPISGVLKIVTELMEAGCPSATSPSQLRDTVTRALSDVTWRSSVNATLRQYADRHCASYGQDAAANVCDVIDSLARPSG